MIVVDTNILCYYWLASPLSPQAEALRERDPDWTAPPLWRSEFRSALSMSIRHRVLSLPAAVELMERAEKLLHERELPVSSRVVLELVTKSSCTAYDCEFVAAAREHGVPLVTMDKRVLREFPHLAISMADFLSR